MRTEQGGFCDRLSAPQRDALQDQSRQSDLRRGDALSSEEMLVWPIIAVASGVLSLQHLLEDGRRTISALFMQGDIVDMRGLVSRHRGQLIALSKVNICRMSPLAFEASLDTNQAAQRVAWNNLRTQTYRAMDHAADLAKKQAMEKLASFVFECRRRQGRVRGDRDVLIPVRRVDLADYLGMQPETVSRCFKDLEEKGIIAFEGISNLKILDFPTLRRIANGDKHTENLRNTGENHFKAANT